MAFMDFLPQFGDNTDTTSSDDATLQQINLKRKLALADSLRNTPELQGQMVSGRYVAPSWTQSLANVANKYIGNKISENAMKEYGTAQKAKEQKMADALKEFKEGMQPTATTTTQDNFVTKPLEQGQSVPTSPYGNTEQVAPTSPYGTQNMQGDMTTNQPTQATTYTPKSQQDLINNFYKYAQNSGNPDIANKFAIEQFNQAIKPKVTKYLDMGDKQVEVDENNTPTGRTLPKGVAPGSDLSNQLGILRLQADIGQHKIANAQKEREIAIQDRAHPDYFGTMTNKTFTEQDVTDTAKGSGKTPQQVRQDFLAKGWTRG